MISGESEGRKYKCRSTVEHYKDQNHNYRRTTVCNFHVDIEETEIAKEFFIL